MTYVSNPAQQPEKSVLDYFNRQAYLGNAFILPVGAMAISGTIEVPLVYVSNPSANSKGLFLYGRNIGSSNTAIFRAYFNPTIASLGIPLTPINLRPASPISSTSACYSNPNITGVDQVQTVLTVADVAGSLNNTYFTLSSVDPVSTQKNWYMWFNVNSAGTDPMIAGATGIAVALSTGATANAVATAMRTAFNALTSDFVATGATNHVIITNVNPGSVPKATEGAQPTGFTFQNTTPGSINFGTLVETVLTQVFLQSNSNALFILDPGQNLLVTAQPMNSGTTISIENVWYEI